MSDLTFRPARREDIGALLALSAAGAPDPSVKRPVDPDDPAVQAAFTAIDSDPSHELMVAMLDDEIVGTFQLSFLPGLPLGGLLRAQLENVHVRPDMRGKGIGAAMMDWAVQRAKTRGAGLVQLTSNKLRSDAHRFYDRLGFKATHEGFKLEI